MRCHGLFPFLHSHGNSHHEMQKATVPSSRSNNNHRAQEIDTAIAARLFRLRGVKRFQAQYQSASIVKAGFSSEMGERQTPPPPTVLSLVLTSVPSQWGVIERWGSLVKYTPTAVYLGLIRINW